jgi:hypothetical protein
VQNAHLLYELLIRNAVFFLNIKKNLPAHIKMVDVILFAIMQKLAQCCFIHNYAIKHHKCKLSLIVVKIIKKFFSSLIYTHKSYLRSFMLAEHLVHVVEVSNILHNAIYTCMHISIDYYYLKYCFSN